MTHFYQLCSYAVEYLIVKKQTNFLELKITVVDRHTFANTCTSKLLFIVRSLLECILPNYSLDANYLRKSQIHSRNIFA